MEKKNRKNWSDEQTAKGPGNIVSDDQLVSHFPGFISQMTGILTKKRYKHAAVYVHHYSGLGYKYLKKYSDSDETIQGKKAFETYCNHHVVRVKAYHSNNRIFRENKWVDKCRENQ